MPKIKIKDLNKGVDGIQFLRGLISAFDCRNENLNSNKTPNQLINEYLDYCNDVKDLDGNKICEL